MLRALPGLLRRQGAASAGFFGSAEGNLCRTICSPPDAVWFGLWFCGDFPFNPLKVELLAGDLKTNSPALFRRAMQRFAWLAQIPRWDIDKFPTVERTLGTQMKSVGEAKCWDANRTPPLVARTTLRTRNEHFLRLCQEPFLYSKTAKG